MIEVNQFTKVYQLSKHQMKRENIRVKQKTATKEISFRAQEGEIFGLLGPNGAGKTTTLRSIATLLKPTSGTINVNGYDVVEEAVEVRRRIGFLTNELKLDEHFTPSYTVDFFGRLHQMAPATIEQRRQELFAKFGIDGYADKKIGELSTGMKQKLSIVVSLIHDPEVVIFDEPTNGLDIITARTVTDYLQELKTQGKLIIISTHIMSVAEKLADRIVIIIKGQKVAEGTVAEINQQQAENTLEDSFFKLYEQYEGSVKSC